MRLDMFLSAKRYMSEHFEKGDDAKAEIIQKLFPELAGMTGRFGSTSPVKELVIEVGYWRKANAIHKWFVDNVQGGEDNCQPFTVAREDLVALHRLCEQVYRDPIQGPVLLPATNGFFFGSTDYDRGYVDDLRLTMNLIEEALKLPENWTFEYQSSW